VTFDEIVKGGFGVVESLVASRLEETPQLEFKQKRSGADLDLHKDDRRALGESLSGFANAIGGTLIVGVKTDRPDGVDRACNPTY
jgi:predicted HTH transcriptional regulator